MSETLNTLVPGLTFKCHSYGQHSLQRLGIWEYDSPQAGNGGYWVIYIHGGAWRDPRLNLDTFVPCIKSLVSSDQVPNTAVKGYISIDYRLSPHPAFPQDPATTPAPEYRGAKHPDHIQDIRAALAFLKEHHQLSSNYILVGHSAGATLAYQLLMGDDVLAGAPSPEIPLPGAIIGMAGIYDIAGLAERHGDPYKDFISLAFGPDAENWEKASPASYVGSFKEKWASGLCNIVAWSPEDPLVDEPEIDAIVAKLNRDGVSVIVAKDLSGDHNAVWEHGSQAARLVIMALTQLP